MRRALKPKGRQISASGPPSGGSVPRDEPVLGPRETPFVGMKGPLREALTRLGPNARRIDRGWRRLLRSLDSGGAASRISGLDLSATYRHLSKSARKDAAVGEAKYRLAVLGDASDLMRSGVSEDLAIAAIALYLEACLGYSKGTMEIRALVRLTSTTQRLVAERYRDERLGDLRRFEDRERQKLSRDLHDEVGADLVVLKLYVEMIALELAKGRHAQVGPKLQEALVLIAHSIESVRRLSLDLGPAYLDSLGFLPALRSVVRQFGLRTGIKGELTEKGAPSSLPAGLEIAVYRVLLGALSNVAKHSKARRVRVTVGARGGEFVMAVADDGKGFDVRAQTPDRSFGLHAMSERVRGLRGRLRIESWVGPRRGLKSGTRVEIRLPVPKVVVQ
ncbi:MAG: hypothetical protein JJE39_11865 [Vicinamibacteria bacterium]|nr:hypothetical protein [Vicinamibacteria bacterium]